MNYQASTQASVKLNNQRLILDLLIAEGALSRANIAKRINSSKPTVSKNVDELLTDGKLIEVGKSDNSVGKKGILVDVNRHYKYVLGMDLSKNHFRVVISDLRHNWVHYVKHEIDSDLENPDALLDQFFEEANMDIRKIGQIVISYPGVVGHNDQFYLTNLAFKEVFLNNLTMYLKKKFTVPITIRNDLNLSVLTEKAFGNNSDKKNICLISCDVGVGLGIIINHALYEGDRNAAGEIGFVLPTQHSDGRHYTLEERIGIYALLRRYKKETDKTIDFEGLCQLIQEEDETATSIYRSVLDNLLVAITNVASILDIETVIGTGRLFHLKEDMYVELNEMLQKVTPFETYIYESTIYKKALKGAILVGIDQVISDMVTE